MPITRRVMNRFQERDRLPYLEVEEREAKIVLLPGFIVGFAMAVVGAARLILLGFIAGIAIGFAITWASPRHLPTETWIRDLLRYYLARPKTVYQAATETDQPQSEGGLAEYNPLVTAEDTRELTAIYRAWPGAGTIERTDGTMEAFVEIDPANRDFAQSEEWATAQENARAFANQNLTFNMKYHVTTRSFPVHRLVEDIDDRLSDPDVQENETFEELLREYRETRPESLEGTQQFHFYIGVEVSPVEVYGEQQEKTALERLADLPVVGVLLNVVVSKSDGLSDDEIRQRMFTELDDRVRTVEDEFVGAIDDWESRRLSTAELFGLAVDFWNGVEHDQGDVDGLLRESPALRRERRGDEQ